MQSQSLRKGARALFGVRREHSAYLDRDDHSGYWEDVACGPHNRIVFRGTPDDSPRAWRGLALEVQESSTWQQFESNLLECNEEWADQMSLDPGPSPDFYSNHDYEFDWSILATALTRHGGQA